MYGTSIQYLVELSASILSGFVPWNVCEKALCLDLVLEGGFGAQCIDLMSW
jgi:hypothetical protein